MTNKINKTLEERGGRYGSFECNAETTQKLMDVLRQHPNWEKLSNPHKEAYHMIFHKMARSICGDPMYNDNTHDIVGYAKLLEDYINDQNT